MSFFLLGPYLGGGLALILGGTVVQALGNPNGNGGINGLEPWRAAFLVAGCIGVVPALLLFFIREPARPIVAAASVATSFSLGEVAPFMWRERAFYGAFYGVIHFTYITFYSGPAWIATFLLLPFPLPP